jgi:hypothetical protein
VNGSSPGAELVRLAVIGFEIVDEEVQVVLVRRGLGINGVHVAAHVRDVGLGSNTVDLIEVAVVHRRDVTMAFERRLEHLVTVVCGPKN